MKSVVVTTGQLVDLEWATPPAPPNKWLVVNDVVCSGSFGVRAGARTDVELHLQNGGCWTAGLAPSLVP